MKVSVDLNVSGEEFYAVLKRSLEDDALKCTGSRLEAKTGLSFRKNLVRRSTKKQVNSICNVENLKENECYKVSLATNVDTTTISFDIKKTDDKRIHVIYEENTSSNNSKVGINHKVVSTILGFIYIKRNMKKRLKMIESSILSSRIS